VKQGLGLLSRYLYVVTDDTSPDGAARSQLQVLDVKNKLVAGRRVCGGSCASDCWWLAGTATLALDNNATTFLTKRQQIEIS
jgi:hypothetical protein